jgi:cell fate regulator YaaT (PSP1 superfamily)
MMLSTISTENVVIIVGIRFRPAGRIYYFDPQGQAYSTGQYVIVETVRGMEAGRVVIAPKKIAESELSDALKPVLRLASEEELRQMLSFKGREKDALVQCARHVAQHGLPMKLVEAEYAFDGSRLTFYFTADERVDFRALVRDLAATFRTRIELRQIGARDQAKLVGGLGPCGKTLCCSSWITDFGVISIKMAKEQNLPLNPAKISGVCGRLLCCLSYENDNYIRARQQMPQVGALLETPSGSGRVIAINVPKSTVEVVLESGATIEVPVGPLEDSAQAQGGCSSCSAGGAGKCCTTCGANPSASSSRGGGSAPPVANGSAPPVANARASASVGANNGACSCGKSSCTCGGQGGCTSCSPKR